MLNRNDIRELIEEHGHIYCTTETGYAVEKNVLEGLVKFYDLDNPVAKFVGIYEDESFEIEGVAEVYDGDAVYILVEK